MGTGYPLPTTKLYLPPARLRANGQMSELRVADLRFTPGEAVEFLTRGVGLDLLAGDV